MTFEASPREVPDFVVVERCESTNADLAARCAASALPGFATLVTTNQTAGRGRLGRAWVDRPGESIAVSVYLDPVLPDGEPLPLDRYGWFPLIAGVAMAQAVEYLLPGEHVGLKWPNDVLIHEKKASGILAELVPPRPDDVSGAPGVVVGAGVNVLTPSEGLPGDTATSLLVEGADGIDLLDSTLAGYLNRLRSAVVGYLEHGGDAEASGIRSQVLKRCTTIGRSVRVQLPDGDTLLGEAIDLDADGRLLVRDSADGRVVAVAAGDVTHLRYE